MAAEIDPTHKVDARPIRYAPPKSHVSELVQQPLYQITGEKLAAAYMRDYWKQRKPSEHDK